MLALYIVLGIIGYLVIGILVGLVYAWSQTKNNYHISDEEIGLGASIGLAWPLTLPLMLIGIPIYLIMNRRKP